MAAEVAAAAGEEGVGVAEEERVVARIGVVEGGPVGVADGVGGEAELVERPVESGEGRKAVAQRQVVEQLGAVEVKDESGAVGGDEDVLRVEVGVEEAGVVDLAEEAGGGSESPVTRERSRAH